ncbi:MAG: TolC family outer membrane protein [Pseudohongiellaceae bacterium]|nr:TolC family outer membrane protein [Pseudohongiellaceae bacterium]
MEVAKRSYIASLSLVFTLGFSGICFAAETTQSADTILLEGSTLEDFFTSALDYSPRLKIAEESMNIGSQRRKAATGQLLPQISAQGSFSDNKQDVNGAITDYPGERYSVQLSQVLFNWQSFAARKRASYLENQAEAEYYSELGWLLTEVAERYLDVLLAEDTVTSIAAEVEATANQLKQIERLYSIQSAQITDLYDTQARLAAIETQQLIAENELELAREALRSVSGINVGPLYRLDEDVDLPGVDSPMGDWLELAKETNPQIRSRIYAARAADKQVDQAKGAFMPSVNLVAQKQISDLGFDNTSTSRRDTEYIALNLTVPIYAGGRNSAALSEARSQKTIAQDQLRQMRLDVLERTRTAYLQLRSAEQQVASAEKLVEATNLAHTARQRGFELGAVTSVDVLNALRDKFQAERELLRMRYDQIRYSLFLRREAGTLSPDDVIEVSSWLTVEPQ